MHVSTRFSIASHSSIYLLFESQDLQSSPLFQVYDRYTNNSDYTLRFYADTTEQWRDVQNNRVARRSGCHSFPSIVETGTSLFHDIPYTIFDGCYVHIDDILSSQEDEHGLVRNQIAYKFATQLQCLHNAGIEHKHSTTVKRSSLFIRQNADSRHCLFICCRFVFADNFVLSSGEPIPTCRRLGEIHALCQSIFYPWTSSISFTPTTTHVEPLLMGHETYASYIDAFYRTMSLDDAYKTTVVHGGGGSNDIQIGTKRNDPSDDNQSNDQHDTTALSATATNKRARFNSNHNSLYDSETPLSHMYILNSNRNRSLHILFVLLEWYEATATGNVIAALADFYHTYVPQWLHNSDDTVVERDILWLARSRSWPKTWFAPRDNAEMALFPRYKGWLFIYRMPKSNHLWINAQDVRSFNLLQSRTVNKLPLPPRESNGMDPPPTFPHSRFTVTAFPTTVYPRGLSLQESEDDYENLNNHDICIPADDIIVVDTLAKCSPYNSSVSMEFSHHHGFESLNQVLDTQTTHPDRLYHNCIAYASRVSLVAIQNTPEYDSIGDHLSPDVLESLTYMIDIADRFPVPSLQRIFERLWTQPFPRLTSLRIYGSIRFIQYGIFPRPPEETQQRPSTTLPELRTLILDTLAMVSDNTGNYNNDNDNDNDNDNVNDDDNEQQIDNNNNNNNNNNDETETQYNLVVNAFLSRISSNTLQTFVCPNILGRVHPSPWRQRESLCRWNVGDNSDIRYDRHKKDSPLLWALQPATFLEQNLDLSDFPCLTHVCLHEDTLWRDYCTTVDPVLECIYICCTETLQNEGQSQSNDQLFLVYMRDVYRVLERLYDFCPYKFSRIYDIQCIGIETRHYTQMCTGTRLVTPTTKEATSMIRQQQDDDSAAMCLLSLLQQVRWDIRQMVEYIMTTWDHVDWMTEWTLIQSAPKPALTGTSTTKTPVSFLDIDIRMMSGLRRVPWSHSVKSLTLQMRVYSTDANNHHKPWLLHKNGSLLARVMNAMGTLHNLTHLHINAFDCYVGREFFTIMQTLLAYLQGRRRRTQQSVSNETPKHDNLQSFIVTYTMHGDRTYGGMVETVPSRFRVLHDMFLPNLRFVDLSNAQGLSILHQTNSFSQLRRLYQSDASCAFRTSGLPYMPVIKALYLLLSYSDAVDDSIDKRWERRVEHVQKLLFAGAKLDNEKVGGDDNIDPNDYDDIYTMTQNVLCRIITKYPTLRYVTLGRTNHTALGGLYNLIHPTYGCPEGPSFYVANTRLGIVVPDSLLFKQMVGFV